MLLVSALMFLGTALWALLLFSILNLPRWDLALAISAAIFSLWSTLGMVLGFLAITQSDNLVIFLALIMGLLHLMALILFGDASVQAAKKIRERTG